MKPIIRYKKQIILKNDFLNRPPFSEKDDKGSYGHSFWMTPECLRDHPYVTSAKYWVSGSRKWPILLMFSNEFILFSVCNYFSERLTMPSTDNLSLNLHEF